MNKELTVVVNNEEVKGMDSILMIEKYQGEFVAKVKEFSVYKTLYSLTPEAMEESVATFISMCSDFSTLFQTYLTKYILDTNKPIELHPIVASIFVSTKEVAKNIDKMEVSEMFGIICSAVDQMLDSLCQIKR